LVRESVRQALAALGLRWGDLVQPGDRVMLKPNFIRESHSSRPDQWEQIITHGTLIAVVAEEVAESLDGRGSVTIADGPQTDSDFPKICERTRIPQLRERFARKFPGVALEILDLRSEIWRTVNGVIVDRRQHSGDPRGYTLVNLADKSWFVGKSGRFYGADYDSGFTTEHHSNGKHEYLVCRSAMDADVFINLPKLKTHMKCGVTLSLKNLVGINGNKNYLPHFVIGTPDQGGDEFPRSDVATKFQSRAITAFKAVARRTGTATRLYGPLARRLGAKVFGDTATVVRSGNWYGNDTTWRMVLDLNKILFQYDGQGQPRKKPLRYLSIIDGIIAGEGDGPSENDAKLCGLLIAGTNPAATDFAAAKVMGLDWQKIPMIRESFQIFGFTPEEITVVPELGEQFHFRPHFGWIGHIEAS
jgi:uncharacterized protein (DUF362 family)